VLNGTIIYKDKSRNSFSHQPVIMSPDLYAQEMLFAVDLLQAFFTDSQLLFW